MGGPGLGFGDCLTCRIGVPASRKARLSAVVKSSKGGCTSVGDMAVVVRGAYAGGAAPSSSATFERVSTL